MEYRYSYNGYLFLFNGEVFILFFPSGVEKEESIVGLI